MSIDSINLVFGSNKLRYESVSTKSFSKFILKNISCLYLFHFETT